MRRTDEVVGRFFLARNHADMESRALLQLGYGLLAVLRVAQGSRREGHDLRDAERLQELLEALQYLGRPRNAFRLHDTILDVAREPHELLFLHEHLCAPSLDEIDGEAQRIRADIDHSVQHKGAPFVIVILVLTIRQRGRISCYVWRKYKPSDKSERHDRRIDKGDVISWQIKSLP